MAGFVLANGSRSSNQSGEGENSESPHRGHLVDCMVALPGQLFYSTQIPVCLWFLAKNIHTDAKRGFRDRRKQTLFIDARKLGTLIDRVHRELTDTDLQKITGTYHVWRSDGLGSAGFKPALAGILPTTGKSAEPGMGVPQDAISTRLAGGSREDRSHAGRIALCGLGVSAPPLPFPAAGPTALHLRILFSNLSGSHRCHRTYRGAWPRSARTLSLDSRRREEPASFRDMARQHPTSPVKSPPFDRFHAGRHHRSHKQLAPGKDQRHRETFSHSTPSSGRHYYNATMFAERYSTFSL